MTPGPAVYADAAARPKTYSRFGPQRHQAAQERVERDVGPKLAMVLRSHESGGGGQCALERRITRSDPQLLADERGEPLVSQRYDS